MIDQTLDQALTLWREAVLPVADAQRMTLLSEAELRAPPFVLLLGNHSSGKSSLINHLIGRDVQRTGVAPTDDGFTVLFHGTGGPIDGETLTARPDLPFQRLRSFGPGLLRHLRGVPLDAPLLHDVWLVDSPGMIDAGAGTTRPYDFGAVVRRLAEQADLVLVLFDPEKPGTTGETLQVLGQHLSGLEDRLRIVMNKMDLFTGLRDFARAYGALCWNLARALSAQDLPHIYTTALPGRGGLSPESFEAALGELASDIAAMPAHRRDRQLTRMRHDAREVLLRARVTEALRSKVRRRKYTAAVGGLLSVFMSMGLGLFAVRFMPTTLASTITLFACLLGMAFFAMKAARTIKQASINPSADLQAIFEDTYREPLSLGDEALRASWAHVHPTLKKHLSTMGLAAFRRVKPKALRRLEAAAQIALPALHLDNPQLSTQPSTGDDPCAP